MIGIRKLLEKVFTPAELRVLDDVLPEFSRKKKQEEHDMLEEEVRTGRRGTWGGVGGSRDVGEDKQGEGRSVDVRGGGTGRGTGKN